MTEKKHRGRTVAVLGGAGLAAWWLLSRGKGWGFGSSGLGSRVVGTMAKPPVVWVRADRIEIDGVAADLSTVIATCRAAGAAEVHATGDAIHRNVRDLIRGLRAVGVALSLAPNLEYTNWEAT